MRKRNLILFSLLVVVIASLLSAGCGSNSGAGHQQDAQQAEPLRVVTTTSLLAEIVNSVAGDQAEVINIIPPAMCPGHFDVKPEDMKVLADADLFMLHNYQGEKFSDGMIQSAGNANLNKLVYDIEGNWMAPPVRMEAIDKITADLVAARPESKAAFTEAAGKLKEETQRVGDQQKKRLDDAGVSRVNVLVNDMQAGFIKWAGFNVAGIFGRAEDMSPKDIEDLIKLGQSNNVTLVLDNLQSGKEAGIGIAREIGAAQLTLNNFPGGIPDTATWAQAIAKNVDMLLETLP
ncbi:zinc ABC transporter, periplasmic-binding protein ZnuA [Desulfocucumis palustris]|uniref:Zinc ABC transporter, periplasmic-binding protein ZnuA n=1 Tax=Desulfocucumis palustris TaxID=1898651 RepID=A0A2L2XFV6_9FIRM|nr:metal ABC transporter substrate-binding protein [Desulfocucumis palustris]GBF33116.1 zinc ABC transporter, periplasmic-binding protein ZnuA [Desulfocucumis palustris]